MGEASILNEESLRLQATPTFRWQRNFVSYKLQKQKTETATWWLCLVPSGIVWRDHCHINIPSTIYLCIYLHFCEWQPAAAGPLRRVNCGAELDLWRCHVRQLVPVHWLHYSGHCSAGRPQEHPLEFLIAARPHRLQREWALVGSGNYRDDWPWWMQEWLEWNGMRVDLQDWRNDGARWLIYNVWGEDLAELQGLRYVGLMWSLYSLIRGPNCEWSMARFVVENG